VRENRFGNCCRSTVPGYGILSVCTGWPLLLGTSGIGKEIYTAAVATPTEVNSCQGRLQVMLYDSSSPRGEKTAADTMQDLVVDQVTGDKISEPAFLIVPEKLKPLQQATFTKNKSGSILPGSYLRFDLPADS
jgi:hypothetical protein